MFGYLKKSYRASVRLRYAIANNDLPLFQANFEKAPSHDKLEAFFRAARKGHIPLVRFLIEEKKFNPNEKDPASVSPAFRLCNLTLGESKVEGPVLLSAALSGNVDLVRYLVDECKVMVNVTNQYQTSTPLHLATKKGFVSITQFLLERGATPNIKVADSPSPLYYAVASGKLEIVQLIVNAGNKIDDWSVGLAYAKGYSDIFDFLLKNGADPKAYKKCTPVPHYVFPPTKTKLRHRHYKNLPKDEATQLLLKAVTEGDTEVVELLLRKNKTRDLSITNARGEPLLVIAAQLEDYYQNEIVAGELVLAGIDLTAQGAQALHAAIQVNHTPTLLLLLAEGVCANAHDTAGSTALQQAVLKENMDATSSLLQNGADPLYAGKNPSYPCPLQLLLKASPSFQETVLSYFITHATSTASKEAFSFLLQVGEPLYPFIKDLTTSVIQLGLREPFDTVRNSESYKQWEMASMQKSNGKQQVPALPKSISL